MSDAKKPEYNCEVEQYMPCPVSMATVHIKGASLDREVPDDAEVAVLERVLMFGHVRETVTTGSVEEETFSVMPVIDMGDGTAWLATAKDGYLGWVEAHGCDGALPLEVPLTEAATDTASEQDAAVMPGSPVMADMAKAIRRLISRHNASQDKGQSAPVVRLAAKQDTTEQGMEEPK
jgi:hypothetical protein